MPYLDPSSVVQRFSDTLLSEIRPAIPDDDALVRAQAGSMASTLRFLATQLEREEAAVEVQQDVLLTALSETEDTLAAIDPDEGADKVQEAIVAARADVDAASDAPHAETEMVLLEAAESVLAAIDASLDGEDARRCRTPMYRFLDVRLAEHHAVLGREANENE